MIIGLFQICLDMGQRLRECTLQKSFAFQVCRGNGGDLFRPRRVSGRVIYGKVVCLGGLVVRGKICMGPCNSCHICGACKSKEREWSF